MISRINAGILSCIGLMAIYILKSIFLMPNLEISNPYISAGILQLGFLWFNISLWISLRYILVEIHNLAEIRLNLNWIITNVAMIGGLGIINVILGQASLYSIIYLIAIILTVNYIVLFVKLYRISKVYFQNMRYIHYFMTSFIILAIIEGILKLISNYSWRYDFNYLDGFIEVIPLLFLLRFFWKEKVYIQKQINASA